MAREDQTVKPWADEAIAAFTRGDGAVLGAIHIACTPTPVSVWQGWGDLTIDGVVYEGIGDRLMVGDVTASVGASQAGMPLTLSGVDPTTMALFQATAFRLAPVIVWEVAFDKTRTVMLDAQIYKRGRLDVVGRGADANGEGTITATVIDAASGLGKATGRVRSLTDDHLTDPTNNGSRMLAYAGQIVLRWGGKIAQAANLPGTTPPADPPGVPARVV